MLAVSPSRLRRKTHVNIALLSAIAGLFHDFGKANDLFQLRLQSKHRNKHEEAYRHEWVSLRLFQAFVGKHTDAEWLANLAWVTPSDDSDLLAQVIKDSPADTRFNNPFVTLPPLARVVAWLIVTHHKLPKATDERDKNGPSTQSLDLWLTKTFNTAWNSPQCNYGTQTAEDYALNWQFSAGTPMVSPTWCHRAQVLARRIQRHPELLAADFLADPFFIHMSRLTVMLADHCYSASASNPKLHSAYAMYANTTRDTKKLHQRLDEHNLGVGQNALLLAQSFLKLRPALPSIREHDGFTTPTSNSKFVWQDKAFELAKSVAHRSTAQGFFGVNMASTGCGKTFANARIMYGLANAKKGCRFSVALGLRTLTLQTGDALQERLKLAKEDIAVLIGSQSVQKLHELRVAEAARKRKGAKKVSAPEVLKIHPEMTGSESIADSLHETDYIQYTGELLDGRLGEWLSTSDKMKKMVSAPVLISTIDHLMPATEGDRGGKQIAPMLRLLTSDLVLDEPDDFELADLPALCRLVNWAGLLGSRVVLSSATLPPALIRSLFDAYQTGRKAFNAANGYADAPVCCAWFDEYTAMSVEPENHLAFTDAHNAFVARRVADLSDQPSLCRADLMAVSSPSKAAEDATITFANTVYRSMRKLHEQHHQVHSTTGKRVSMGIVRIANINTLAAVSRYLLGLDAPPHFRIHFCVYHSRHPLIVRSEMEKQLDGALSRHNKKALWSVPEVRKALDEQPEMDHIFVVIATSVAEVGRDHDYDWAVAEPSSMRSLIQLAGRLQRHRRKMPTSPNLLILDRNFKTVRGMGLPYAFPGFETKAFHLAAHDMQSLLLPEQFEKVDATPRIQPRVESTPTLNLVDLEHHQLAIQMQGAGSGDSTYAAQWWEGTRHGRVGPGWCAEFQRQTPFRAGAETDTYVLQMEEDDSTPTFHVMVDDGVYIPVEQSRFRRVGLDLGDRVQPWMTNDVASLVIELAEKLGQSVEKTSQTFAEIRLRDITEQTNDRWTYNPLLGVFGEI